VGIVSASKTGIYRQRKSGHVLAVCRQGTPLGIVGENGSWYGVLMVDLSTGWVKKSAVSLLDYDLVATRRPSARNSSSGNQIVQVALRYTGIPYVWGGTTANGLDCSGFVQSVFSNFGVSLPRVARDQANVGQPIPLSLDQLQAGDRLYFSCKGREVDHAGIYIGNGLFIHSSSRRGGVAVDNLTTPFYARNLITARRS
jgi:cell wall-associated NlpC family hydrolase